LDAFWNFVWSQLTPSALVAIIIFVVGTWIKATIEKGEQHEWDKKLEAIRSDLRREEEARKADFKARDDQLTSLRAAALAGLSTRHSALEQRRLNAIEKIWSATVDRRRFHLVASVFRTLKFEKALKAAAQNDVEGQKVQKFASAMAKAFGVEEPKPAIPGDEERLFVSPLAWALFSSYGQIVSYPVVALSIMRFGQPENLIRPPAEILELAKASLPEWSKFIDEWGVASIASILGPLEEKLFSELQRSLVEPGDYGEAAVREAAKILALAEKEGLKTKVEIPDAVRAEKEPRP